MALYSHGLYSYGPYSHGLYSYGPYSYGPKSNGADNLMDYKSSVLVEEVAPKPVSVQSIQDDDEAGPLGLTIYSYGPG